MFQVEPKSGLSGKHEKLDPDEGLNQTGAVFTQCAMSPCAAWQEVEQKLGDEEGGESACSQGGPVQYTEKTPSAAMKSEYTHTHTAPGSHSQFSCPHFYGPVTDLFYSSL